MAGTTTRTAALVLLGAACAAAPPDEPLPGDSRAREGDGTRSAARLDAGGAPEPSAAAPSAEPVDAEPLGTTAVVYAPKNIDNELLAYNRVIRLAHAGAANGSLLAVFEHSTVDRSPAELIVQRSVDRGRTWSTLATVLDGEKGPGRPGSFMYQPFLFELPRALGKYPAGTLLLTANVIDTAATERHFQLWRSTDHGATWSFVTTYQTADGGGPGIWEPFFDLDGDGNLVCGELEGHFPRVDAGVDETRSVVRHRSAQSDASLPLVRHRERLPGRVSTIPV